MYLWIIRTTPNHLVGHFVTSLLSKLSSLLELQHKIVDFPQNDVMFLHEDAYRQIQLLRVTSKQRFPQTLIQSNIQSADVHIWNASSLFSL